MPVAVVTGASSGFGKGIATELAQTGYFVIGIARNEERLGTVAEEIGGSYVLCDVTDTAQVNDAAAEIMAEYGAVSVLVNSAGEPMREHVLDADPDEITRVFDANSVGIVRLIQAFRPALEAAAPQADVIDIASAAATIANPNSGPYSASKAGQLSMTKSLRIDLAKMGISFHAILPGKADTEGHPQAPSSSIFSRATSTDVETVTRRTVGRIGKRPKEVYVPRLLKLPAVVGAVAPVTTTKLVSKLLG